MPCNLRVFISHAARDRAAISRLERTLSQWGLLPWVDRQALAGGQQWSAELQRAIAQSAALVLVVTPASLASDMVRREYRTALELRIPVILLVLRPVPVLPEELASLPQIDWIRKKWVGEEKLFLALYDQGIRPDEHNNVLGSQWPVNVLLSNERRAPEAWQRYAVARRTYAVLAGRYAFLVAGIMCIGYAAPTLLATVVVTESGPGSSAAAVLLNMLTTIGVPILLVICMIVVRLALIPAVAFACYYFAWWSPEGVVVTDTSVSANLFRFRWARAAVEPRHYPFAAMQSIEQRRTLWGSVVLSMRARDKGVIATLRLPRRLTDVRAVAAHICDAVHTFQASHQHVAAQSQTSPQAADQQAVANVQTASLASVPARAPRYVVLAGLDDQPLLTTIQSQLAWRGLHMVECVRLPHPEAVIMPTAVGAARAGFALVFLSNAVLRSARLQSIVSDLVARGILIIPIVVSARLHKPPMLTQFQWVDFSAGIDRRLSLCDLLNALDAAGVPLTSSTQTLDGDLILARAMHDRPLPDWQVFKVHSQTRTVYRIYQVARSVGSWGAVARALMVLICTSLLVVLINSLMVNSFALATPQMDLAIAALSLVVFIALGVAPAVGIRLGPFAGGTYAQLIRGAVVPEMIVVTPVGVVVHVVNVRANRFDDYVLPFTAIQAIERRRGYYVPLRLRCRLKDGSIAEFGLPGQLVDVDVAATTIEQRWRAVPSHGAAGSP